MMSLLMHVAGNLLIAQKPVPAPFKIFRNGIVGGPS
jgi:hypothetical protein